MSLESLRLRTSETLGDFLLENIHRSLFGVRNLKIAREHLQQGGSVLLYFDHFAKLDPILYGKIIMEYLAPLNRVAAIASYRHTDPKRGLLSNIQRLLIEDWQEKYGITTFPVIQAKDKEDYENADELNRAGTGKAIKFLRKPGHILAVSPEGTRSKINELLPAEEGFEVLFRLSGRNVLALPVAGVHSTIRPFNTQTKVLVGAPFSFEEIQRESKLSGISITELAMRRIANLLPEQNRGFYK